MKNWTKLITFLTISTTLAACSNDTEETVAAPETEQESTAETVTDSTETTETTDTEEVTDASETTDSNETTSTTDQSVAYQAELDQAQAQYDAKQLDEAAGTLSVLLKQDLSPYPSIKTEAESLLEEITLAQAEQARQVAGTSSDKTEHQTERSSTVLAEKYLAEKSQPIAAATDDELEGWLAEQNNATKEVNSEAETNNEETADTSKSFATDEEAENYAFNQLVTSQQLTNEEYIFFVNKTDAQWVTIEVRESIEQDGVEWSNMIGTYRYNLENDTIEKLNSISGNYEAVN